MLYLPTKIIDNYLNAFYILMIIVFIPIIFYDVGIKI